MVVVPASIKTVLVSCGTCYDQLAGYEFEKIFPGCRILDIHEYLLEKGVRLEQATGVRYMYHDPCHSPMKQHNPLKLVNLLMNAQENGEIQKNDRCCGESGTLAVSRPDISTQVRFRKEDEMRKGAEQLRDDAAPGRNRERATISYRGDPLRHHEVPDTPRYDDQSRPLSGDRQMTRN